jgi:hypothetical protein
MRPLVAYCHWPVSIQRQRLKVHGRNGNGSHLSPIALARNLERHALRSAFRHLDR